MFTAALTSLDHTHKKLSLHFPRTYWNINCLFLFQFSWVYLGHNNIWAFCSFNPTKRENKHPNFVFNVFREKHRNYPVIHTFFSHLKRFFYMINAITVTYGNYHDFSNFPVPAGLQQDLSTVFFFHIIWTFWQDPWDLYNKWHCWPLITKLYIFTPRVNKMFLFPTVKLQSHSSVEPWALI